MLEEKKTILLTWHQVKFLRENKGKGKKPTWFNSIENAVINNQATREAHTRYRHKKENQIVLLPVLQYISEDKRKME